MERIYLPICQERLNGMVGVIHRGGQSKKITRQILLPVKNRVKPFVPWITNVLPVVLFQKSSNVFVLNRRNKIALAAGVSRHVGRPQTKPTGCSLPVSI